MDQGTRSISIRTAGAGQYVSLVLEEDIGTMDALATTGLSVAVAGGVPPATISVDLANNVLTTGDEAMQLRCQKGGHGQVNVRPEAIIIAEGNVNVIELIGCASGTVDVHSVLAADRGYGVYANTGAVVVTNHGFMRSEPGTGGGAVRLQGKNSRFEAMPGSLTVLGLSGRSGDAAAISVPDGGVEFMGRDEDTGAQASELNLVVDHLSIRTPGDQLQSMGFGSFDLVPSDPAGHLGRMWTGYLNTITSYYKAIEAKTIEFNGKLAVAETGNFSPDLVRLTARVELGESQGEQLNIRYMNRDFRCMENELCVRKTYITASSDLDSGDPVSGNSEIDIGLESQLKPADLLKNHFVFNIGIPGSGMFIKSSVSLYVPSDDLQSIRMISLNNHAKTIAENGIRAEVVGSGSPLVEMRLSNSGDVRATGYFGTAMDGRVGDATGLSMLNTGKLSSEGTGIRGAVSDGRLAIVNVGDVDASELGINATGNCHVMVANLGVVTLRKSLATGILTENTVSNTCGAGEIHVFNAGDIVLAPSEEITFPVVNVYGIFADLRNTRNFTLLNSGLISVSGSPEGAGIYIVGRGVNPQTARIVNRGRVVVEGDYSDGIVYDAESSGVFSLTNIGIVRVAGAESTGISTRSNGAFIHFVSRSTVLTHYINNAGTIEVTGENSRGIAALKNAGERLVITNSGRISASGPGSVGVDVYNKFTTIASLSADVSIANTGEIRSDGIGVMLKNPGAVNFPGRDVALGRITFTNEAGAVVWGRGGAAVEAYSRSAVTVTNQGSIRGNISLRSEMGSDVGSSYLARPDSITEVVLPEDSGMAPITLDGGSVDIQAGSKMRVRIPDQVWTRGTAKLIEVGGAGRIRMNGSLSGARVGHERDDKTSADWVWADVDWDQVAGLVKLTGGLSSDRTVYRINWDIDQDSVTRWQNTVAAGARHLVSPVRDSLKAVRSGALTGRAFGVLQAMGLNEQFSKTYRQILPASQPLHLLHSAPSLFRMMDGGLSHRHGITGEEVTASFESTELEGLQGWHVSMRTSDGGSAKVMGLDTQAGRNFRFGTMLSSAGSSRTGSGDLRQTSFSSELASVSAYGLYRNGKVFGDVRLGVGRGWSRTHAAIEVLNTDTTSQGTAWGMSSRALVGLDLGIVRPYASLSLTQMSQDPFDLVGEDVRITAGGSSRLDTSVRLGVSIEQEVSLGEARRLTLGMNGSWTKALNPKGGSLRYGYGRSGDPLTYQMEIDGDDEHQFTLSPSAQLDLGEHMEMKGSLHARYSPSDGAQVEASTSFSWQF